MSLKNLWAGIRASGVDRGERAAENIMQMEQNFKL